MLEYGGFPSSSGGDWMATRVNDSHRAITVILEQTSYLGVLISFTLKQCKIMTLQNNEQQYHIRDEDD